jgi:hypothetical protein
MLTVKNIHAFQSQLIHVGKILEHEDSKLESQHEIYTKQISWSNVMKRHVSSEKCRFHIRELTNFKYHKF